jgi:hypothetical protein
MNVMIGRQTKTTLLNSIARRVEAPTFEQRNREEARREAAVLAQQILSDVLFQIERAQGRMIRPATVEV